VTKFGQGDGRGGPRTGAFSGRSNTGQPADQDREERISVKDNRRIDPRTGQVRQPAGGGAGGPVPADGTAAAGEGSVIPEDSSGNAPTSDELAAARQEAAERTADLQRITAEYANYRKRADRDKQAAAMAGKAAVMNELLAVLDDLDRAEEHGDLTGGFKTVADKLTGILERLGLKHYGAPGDEFDPMIHDAVQFATSAEVDHPTVTTVLRLGYLFEERVLRPAVVVVTGPEHESDGAGGGAGESGADDAAAGEPGAGDAAASDSGADTAAGAGGSGDGDAARGDEGAAEAATSDGESAAE
jgi:molecular chaperone GrpE